MGDNRPAFAGLNDEKVNILKKLPTPCYVIDEMQLMKNGSILRRVQENTGCKILLAQKAFSNYNLYPVLEQFLAGTEASGLYEARLGKEEFPNGECHVFSAAYREQDFEELLKYADHIVFNSPAQLKKYGYKAKKCGKSIGLRINPECSTQEGHAIYDPCAPGSRLGTTLEQWKEGMTEELFKLLDGLHFHTLCEQNSDALETTLAAVEQKFGEYLPRLKWLNMGGGHHITRNDYDVERLEKLIIYMRDKYEVQIYLEPGEAVALNAGYLVTEVLDTFSNGEYKLAITDMSAACHTPDVIEMPYLPPLFMAEAVSEDNKGNSKYNIRLGGPTCLAGDIIGDYSFDEALQIGDKLIFGDMAIYTTCKNNTFNGMPLPDIYVLRKDNVLQKIVSFGYEDFKCRLGSAKKL